ncbi:lysophospholipid acyltransferase family protein [Phenylobacterium sp.]|uniref:lysophospholipid acyltransferase family protein n=1 Tax=Phenylobacterium sp. TaxID=1871053 RepID=UPI002FD8C8BE
MSDARPSFGQDLAWRLEALAYDLVTAPARILPIDWVSDFGSWLLRRLGPMTSAHRVVLQNLRIAFPDLPAEEIDALADAQWSQTGRTFAEFPIIDRIVRARDRIRLEGGERLAEIARTGEAVVFVSGHLSNWEIMPAVIANSGVTCHMTYRPANNPYFDARIRRNRFKYGVRLFAPKGGDGAREVLEALGRGESVALMNDQKFNSGVAAPVFGRMAHTAPGPSRLALRFDTVLQPMSVQRLDKARFRVVVHPPIKPVKTGDRTADIQATVERINRFVEERVRERPAEWFWTHKRWPTEIYARKRR